MKTENLKKHPDQDKYKRVNLGNTAFQARVYQVRACVTGCGWV